MIKDDYFELTYRILGSMYQSFRNGESVKFKKLLIDFGENGKGYICNVLESLVDEGFIKVDEYEIVSLHFKIKRAGIEYLFDDPHMIGIANEDLYEDFYAT